MPGNRAQSIRSANGISGARIFTFAVDARFVGRAIFISATSNAAHVVQANVAEEAVVINPAGQHTSSADAFFIEGALRVDSTASNTTAFFTPRSAGTLVIPLAGNRRPDAFLARSFCKSDGARTRRFVIFSIAHSVQTTASINQARVDTLSSNAGFARRAVSVRLTSGLTDTPIAVHIRGTLRVIFTRYRLPLTTNVGIAAVTLATNAQALVIFRQAICVRSARH